MSRNRISPLGWLGIALVIAIGVMVLFGVLSMSTFGGYYGMMGSSGWGWGILMMAVPGVILVLVLVAALGGISDRSTYAPYTVPLPRETTPVDILSERYARGEISREEYLRAREDLDSRTSSPVS